MNQTLEVIRDRYSCRSFSDRAIPEKELLAVARAGVQAPSAMNRQDWRVVAVKDAALIKEIEAEGLNVMSGLPDSGAYERIIARGGKLFYNAQSVVFIAIKPPAALRGYELIDLGIVAENVVLAAASLGIDSCHCGLVSFCFSGEKAGSFKKRLGFPDGYECFLAVLLGYGTEKGAPHEPDEAKIVVI